MCQQLIILFLCWTTNGDIFVPEIDDMIGDVMYIFFSGNQINNKSSESKKIKGNSYYYYYCFLKNNNNNNGWYK